MPILPTSPSVSVVLPTFNSSKFLPDAIASVRAQKWPDLEVVVVDDGSTDDTLSVLNKLGGSNLRVIEQPNAGPAVARNTGIAEARNDWIAFLDADDCWEPNKLSVQFNELRRQPDARFCFSDVTFVCPDGREREVSFRLFGRPLLLELLKGNALATPSILVRRACFEEVGVFDTKMRISEDWDMWLRLAARFEHAMVRHPLVTCRGWTFGEKYELEALEHCVLRVLDRLFSSEETMARWPQLPSLLPKVYAWHHSVLAKSYLRHGRFGGFCRMAASAIRSHPIALRYLTRRGALKGSW